MRRRNNEILTRITAVSYTIPTETEESDGTLYWDSTTMVIVHAEGGGKTKVRRRQHCICYRRSRPCFLAIQNPLLVDLSAFFFATIKAQHRPPGEDGPKRPGSFSSNAPAQLLNQSLRGTRSYRASARVSWLETMPGRDT